MFYSGLVEHRFSLFVFLVFVCLFCLNLLSLTKSYQTYNKLLIGLRGNRELSKETETFPEAKKRMESH